MTSSGPPLPAAETAPNPRQVRPWLWLAAKWLLFAVTFIAVAMHAAALWRQLGSDPITWNGPALVAALLATVAGWFPSAQYWRMLLQKMHGPLAPLLVVRAHYIGHLGKYVPGKALALVIRAALVRPLGVPPSSAVIAGFDETLVTMGVGTSTALALSPWLPNLQLAMLPVPRLSAGPALVWSCGVTLVAVSLLHLASRFGHPIVGQLLPARLDRQEIPLPILSLSEATLWYVRLTAGWWTQGLALLLCIQAVHPFPMTMANWTLCTAGTSAASVLGFVALFAPGGLAVREGVLMAVLQVPCGPSTAVLAPLLLRGVGLLGELIASAALYYCVRHTVSRA